MEIIAHRAYRSGPDPARENGLAAVVDCLRQGWGVEIDIRREGGSRFYISHDPVADAAAAAARDAAPFFDAVRAHGRAPIALNVKELGYEADLIAYLREQDVLDRVFLFDMELLERERGRSARRFRALAPAVRVAARVSDRGEGIEGALAIEEADVVWVDEFDRLWVTEADVTALKARGRAVYAISPEIHGFSAEEMSRRWRQFAAWGVDGVCTDFPERARVESAAARDGIPA